MNLTHHDILNMLQTGRPISIVRAGDGEKLLLESNQSIQQYQQCMQSVVKRQLGFEPIMTDVDAMRENLITAYKGADVIGIPMQKHLATLNAHWRGVEATVKPYSNTLKYCSTDVAYDMLYAGMFETWLQGARDLVYIGCRDLDEGFKRHFGIIRVHSYIIPPEAKFTTGYVGESHYPYHYNKIEWWLDNARVDGSPCLIGAGAIGKIYTNWCRDRGGVAFDVGSVMDEWYGAVTRGSERRADYRVEEGKGYRL